MNKVISVIAIALLFSSCQSSRNRLLESEQSQVKLRQIQTRAFDTTDKPKMLRAILSTLQDLGFIIDKADMDLATISATKLDGFQLKMTASVRDRGRTQLLVRANAQVGLRSIDDPVPYRNFFNSLSKAIFLEAQQVD
jgi:PBP1b-binding outer membrane lipoprotein LpoB